MNRIIKNILPAFFVFLVCGILSTAQCQMQNKFAQQGTVELGGNISYENDTYSYNLTAEPYIGWFPIDGLEIGFDPIQYFYRNGYFWTGYATIYSQSNAMILFAPSYNLKLTHTSFLCIEGLIGYAHIYAYGNSDPPTGAYGGPFTESDSGIAYGGHISLKLALSNSGLFNIGVQYLRIVYPASQDFTFGYNDISLIAGFTVVL